jgi:tetratricopeptide (TPR) repeat protein
MRGRVLRIIPVLFLMAPAPAHAQQQIDPHSLALAEALATYRGGDLRAALARLETIPDEKLTETVSRFCTRDDVRPPLRLVRMRITAALLTEMAFVQIQKNPFAWRDVYMLTARALKFLRQAVALDPQVAEARLRLGRVLLRKGDLEGALRELRAALVRPDDQIRYLACTFLGMAGVERGDLEGAEQCYTEALRLFPAGQIAMLARSEAAYLSGRGADAAGQVGSMLRIQRKEDPWWMYLLGDWWHFEARLIRLRAEALR